MSIENICHFIFGFKEQTEEFLFCFYIAVFSAYIINKPDKIYFYYHYEPFGKWWEETKKIPSIKLEKIDIPTHIGSKEIIKVPHKADWARINILFNKGGIYLDIDTICIKPWKELLLKNDVVLGKQWPHPGICNAIMFTKPKTEFFKIWLENYEKHFLPEEWNEASIELPLALSKEYPHLLHVEEPETFFRPSWRQTDQIFKDKNDIPTSLISLHLWETHGLEHIKKINDWSWSDKNSHTIYGKILLKLKKYLTSMN